MRQSDWLVTGFSIVVFAAATAMAPKSPASSVIDLRAGAGERVVLVLNLAPVAVSSLPALDESSLFGIDVEPRMAEVLPADIAPLPPVTAPRRGRRVASRPRRFGATALVAMPVEAPKAALGKADLAVVEVEAPAWRPRSVVGLTPDGPVSTSGSTSLGFKLNERMSLNVGPLSSVAPRYAPDVGHGDLNDRWRLQGEDDASQAPGAAVGMTFKLN